VTCDAVKCSEVLTCDCVLRSSPHTIGPVVAPTLSPSTLTDFPLLSMSPCWKYLRVFIYNTNAVLMLVFVYNTNAVLMLGVRARTLRSGRETGWEGGGGSG